MERVNKNNPLSFKLALLGAALIPLLSACGGSDSSGTDNIVNSVENKQPNVVVSTVAEIESGAEVYMTSSATDSDGTVTSYQWSQKSGYAVTIRDKNQANASFTAPVLDADTTLEFELLVTDDKGATAKDTFNVKIKRAQVENQLPNIVITTVAEIGAGAEVYMTSSATDSDGTIASYQWSQKSGYGVTIRDNSQANASFTAPVLDADTRLEFELLVSDDKGGEAKDTVSVLVKRAEVENQLPNVVITTVAEIESGAEVYMSSSATDPDGTIASYQWSQKSGYGVTIRDNNQANASFTAPVLDADTTLEFELLVIDDKGGEAKDIVRVKIQSAAQTSNYYESCNTQLALNVLNIYDETLNFSSLSGLKKWFCSAPDINNSNFTKRVINLLSVEDNEEDIELWKVAHCSDDDKGFGASMSANLLLQVADDEAKAGWSNCIAQKQMLSCHTFNQVNLNPGELYLNYGLKQGSSQLTNVDIVATNLTAIDAIPDTLEPDGKALLFKKDDTSSGAYFELSGTLDNEHASCSYTMMSSYSFGAELCEVQRLNALEQGKISQRDYTELKYINSIPEFDHRNGRPLVYLRCE
ncbi:PKD domain-containing protein [Pseudoalteromonas citrea]|uniref:PKD domain-containing protein n=1 Tax=Pseudoalteromonas citrea TaxID=43655 RepID=UPI002016A1AE|nr:hypothetical protein [Pseudoalteromonas citrea]